jgi:hypothetical protein
MRKNLVSEFTLRLIQRTHQICFSYISRFLVGLACPVICLAFARSAANNIRGMYPLLCVVPWDAAIQNIKTTARFLYVPIVDYIASQLSFFCVSYLYLQKEVPFWESNSCLSSREISFILYNTVIQYHFHKSLALVPVMSQINPVHTVTFYFKFILILFFHPRLAFKVTLPLHFSY